MNPMRSRRGRERAKIPPDKSTQTTTTKNPRRFTRGRELMAMALQTNSDSEESLFNCSLDSEYIPSSLENSDNESKNEDTAFVENVPPAENTDSALHNTAPVEEIFFAENINLSLQNTTLFEDASSAGNILPLQNVAPFSNVCPQENVDLPRQNPAPFEDVSRTENVDMPLQNTAPFENASPAEHIDLPLQNNSPFEDISPAENIDLSLQSTTIFEDASYAGNILPLQNIAPFSDVCPQENVDLPRQNTAPFEDVSRTENVDMPLQNTALREILPHNSPRKRKVGDPSKWKVNIQKQKRLKGQSYVTKKGRVMPAKNFKEAKCATNPKHKCSSFISEEDRQQLYTEFRNLENLQEQRTFVINHVSKKKKNRSTTQGDSRRNFTLAYTLTVSGEKKTVCREYFLDTLNITGGFVKGALKKLSPMGTLTEDKRGKKPPANKLSTTDEDTIKQHIMSFPAVESHYCRKDSDIKYLDSSLNISILYKLYKTQCTSNATKAASFETYRKVFKRYKLSFHKPKKDICKQCLAFKDMSTEEKLVNEEENSLHILRKNQARASRDKDKDDAKNDSNTLSFNFDLQAVLYTPKGPAGPFFYVRKLAVYNLTLYVLATQEVSCYMWDETEGKRGSVEIATCIYTFIMSQPNIKKVKMMSDGAGGQQKNYHFCTMCLQTLKDHQHLEIIDHKFFESGHSQMECDSVHSKIERKAKRVPMYTPDSWVQTVRVARTNPAPFVVHNLQHDDFIDFGSQIDYKKHWNDDKISGVSDAIWIQYRKEVPNTIFLKTSYDENEPFLTMTMKKKRGKAPIIPKAAYSERIKIAEKKKSDLLKLCREHQIPRMYHDFYYNLPSCTTVRDALPEPDFRE